MFRLGETQELIVQKTVDFGVYLSQEDAPEERVLLPKKQVPEGTVIGSILEVFLYKDYFFSFCLQGSMSIYPLNPYSTSMPL